MSKIEHQKKSKSEIRPRRIKVDLKEQSYDILIGIDNLSKLPGQLARFKFSRILIISDTTVDALYGNLLRKTLKRFNVTTIKIPTGEKHKNLYTVSAIYDQMVNAQIQRDTLVLAFGGGVVGDIAGFVAATYMRGLPLVQIPTTLLAQVDSSIGGKTGVDHPQGKNIIGAFYQPKLVFIDIDFLKTLPPREFKTGLAEVLKYGIIKDPVLFRLIEKNPKANSQFWQNIVTRCAKIKAEVVSKDEKETKGLRMILNLGHTFAHAFESLTGYEKLTHGEAVALGILAASHLSISLKILSKENHKRIVGLVHHLKLPQRIDLSSGSVIKALYMDKKVKSGKIRFVLPALIGKVIIKDNVSLKHVKAALKEMGCK